MKAYVKPELFYERYELSQYIATCTPNKWNFAPGYCSINIGGLGDNYLNTIDICANTTEEYCYMNSTMQGMTTHVS